MAMGAMKRCKKCGAIYVDHDIYQGKCPACGAKS